WPIACSFTLAMKSRTTLKLTSASSNARRTSRNASFTSSSVSLPRPFNLPKTLCSRVVNPSNAIVRRPPARSFFRRGFIGFQPLQLADQPADGRLPVRRQPGDGVPQPAVDRPARILPTHELQLRLVIFQQLPGPLDVLVHRLAADRKPFGDFAQGKIFR